MSSLKTLHDRILVRPVTPELVADIEGFEVVGKADTSPDEGIVVRVGDGRTIGGVKHPLLVDIGDHILYKGANPIKVDVGGEELLVMSEGEVLAVLETD